jgi:hypothetical protein
MIIHNFYEKWSKRVEQYLGFNKEISEIHNEDKKLDYD